MFINLIWAGALIMCLAHTEALTDNDECRFKDKYFTLSTNTESNENQDTTCQEDCANLSNCLLWEEEDGMNSCTLTVLHIHQTEDGSSVSGIANCGLYLGVGDSCGEIKHLENQIVETEDKIVKGANNQEECKAKCLNMEGCLTWRWNGKRDRCIFQQYTLKDSVGKSTFGVSCSTAPTTTAPTTTAPTTTATTTTAPTTTAPTTTAPTTTTPENPECSVYTTLDDTTRSIKYGDGTGDSLGDNYYCDNNSEHYFFNYINTSPGWKGESWYRMPARTRIPEKSPGNYYCGTEATGYLKGTHPTTPGESLDNAKFCFDFWKIDDCHWSSMGSITHCGQFMVYKLKDAPVCNLRYCYTDKF